MSVWRYKAIPFAGAGGTEGSRSSAGEISAETAADARASLRRIGLQATDLRQIRSLSPKVPEALLSHLRRRRQPTKSEQFDSLATMLESGLPILECVDALVGAARSRRSGTRSMLIRLREALRAGTSLADAMFAERSWFDEAEIAMVRAGQHSGELPGVLRTLAERHQRTGELTSKLTAALAYPTIVACVGLGVVVFLSTKTLPELTKILDGAGIETPRLTAGVMTFGGVLAAWWWLLATPLASLLLASLTVPALLRRRRVVLPDWTGRLVPHVIRRIAVARFALGMAELVRAGVPVVEALRVLVGTIGGPGGSMLGRALTSAAERVERGEDLADALDDERWFEPEFRRLLAIGQASGELETLLQRLGERYERRARRLIDRLAALLEPGVILILAFLVGLVVLAAVLPMIRLQEVI
jgi:general secretion pathway protein F